MSADNRFAWKPEDVELSTEAEETQAHPDEASSGEAKMPPPQTFTEGLAALTRIGKKPE
jgi:hypothetical protein